MPVSRMLPCNPAEKLARSFMLRGCWQLVSERQARLVARPVMRGPITQMFERALMQHDFTQEDFRVVALRTQDHAPARG